MENLLANPPAVVVMSTCMPLTSAEIRTLDRRRALRKALLRRDIAHQLPHLSGQRLVLFSQLVDKWSGLLAGGKGPNRKQVGDIEISRRGRDIPEQRSFDVYASRPHWHTPVRSLVQLRRAVAALPDNCELLVAPPSVRLSAGLRTLVRSHVHELEDFLLRHLDGAVPMCS